MRPCVSGVLSIGGGLLSPTVITSLPGAEVGSGVGAVAGAGTSGRSLHGPNNAPTEARGRKTRGSQDGQPTSRQELGCADDARKEGTPDSSRFLHSERNGLTGVSGFHLKNTEETIAAYSSKLEEREPVRRGRGRGTNLSALSEHTRTTNLSEHEQTPFARQRITT